MARTIEQIQASMIATVQATPELAEATSTSTRALWRLWTYVQAVAIHVLELLMDSFQADIEDKISKSVAGTDEWLTSKVLDFQYSATNPQILTLVDLVPTYPVVDDSLKLITRCAVTTTVSNQVVVKVAKNEPPEALTPTELISLQSYINNIGVVGIDYLGASAEADRIWIDADIYYNGQYSGVIEDTVNGAIDTFLSTLPFNGVFKVSDLEVAIRTITGVDDVVINNLKVREESVLFANGSFLVQNNCVYSRLYPTVSGYMVVEDTETTGLTFIAS